MAASSPAIELRAAARSFGERQALQPLDLAIEPGEIFGLLGPNGSGKTTTLRILATLIPPTSGSARVLGNDVVADPMAVRRSIGVMPERPGLYERLNIRDNLVFWADAHGVDRATSVARALEFVGLSDRSSERVGQLSKGWRQRVALARAVLHRPPVLLLDEPSSGLDPAAAAAMESMIRDLVASGATVLMNTHRLAEAERICDRVAILRQGSLLQLGTPRQLRNRLLGGVVRVELATPPDAGLRAAANSWAFASAIEWGPNGFSARLADPSTHTPKLVAALVGAGAGVLSVVQEGDLEAAYLKLMGDDAAATELESAA